MEFFFCFHWQCTNNPLEHDDSVNNVNQVKIFHCFLHRDSYSEFCRKIWVLIKGFHQVVNFMKAKSLKNVSSQVWSDFGCYYTPSPFTLRSPGCQDEKSFNYSYLEYLPKKIVPYFHSFWVHRGQQNKPISREEKPTRCHWMVYCTCNMLNMFRALLCPSSGARDYMCYYRLWRAMPWLLEVRCRAAGYACGVTDVAA